MTQKYENKLHRLNAIIHIKWLCELELHFTIFACGLNRNTQEQNFALFVFIKLKLVEIFTSFCKGNYYFGWIAINAQYIYIYNIFSHIYINQQLHIYVYIHKILFLR